jgi:NAD(P)-dependent dehydrogenase (short-subunit alcohol dehydrogenase family)
VTGATRGIGRAIALACAREGAAVVVNGRDEVAGRAVLAEIAAIGARAAWHAADLGRVAEARRLVRAALDEFGRIDVLVNNAGVFERRPALEMEERDWDQVLDVNLKGAFFCPGRGAAMQERGAGRAIVNAWPRTRRGAAGSIRALTTRRRRPGWCRSRDPLPESWRRTGSASTPSRRA